MKGESVVRLEICHKKWFHKFKEKDNAINE